jgi:hypothetical protein
MKPIDPTLIFNLPNLAYWGLFSLLIFIETSQIATGWPERARWSLGYLSLFGSSLLMVTLAGWNFYTWLLLLIAVLLVRLSRPEQLLSIWNHPSRESYRWTAQYFTAFIICIPIIIYLHLDLITWICIFFALGLAGAIKVGYAAAVNSHLAAELRQAKLHKEEH